MFKNQCYYFIAKSGRNFVNENNELMTNEVMINDDKLTINNKTNK